MNIWAPFIVSIRSSNTWAYTPHWCGNSGCITVFTTVISFFLGTLIVGAAGLDPILVEVIEDGYRIKIAHSMM